MNLNCVKMTQFYTSCLRGIHKYYNASAVITANLSEPPSGLSVMTYLVRPSPDNADDVVGGATGRFPMGKKTYSSTLDAIVVHISAQDPKQNTR